MNKRTETFLKGIENLKKIGFEKQLSLAASAKMFVFYICLCALAKEQTVGKNVFFINGPFEVKKDDPTDGNNQRIHVRKFSGELKNLREQISLVSLVSRKNRLKIIFSSIISVPRSGHLLGRWLEYQLLKDIFDGDLFDNVYSFGHYDEFTYWLTTLCEEHKYKYTMYQHGVVIDNIIIPNKIYCNELHVFNKYSEKVFKNNIIKNTNCNYCIDGFKTNIDFKQITKEDNIKYVGIVDQTFPEWLKYMTDCVSGLEGYIAVVMLHPLSPENILEDSDSVIVTREKYDNLDCVIADFSTLVLDYVSIGYKGTIICTDKEACEGLFGEYNLKYVEKENIRIALPEIIKERGDIVES